jgi:glycosyltransferase involved in cell wall biosynthesis
MRIALLTTNLQPNNGWATVAVKRGAALMALGVEVVALTARGDAPPDGITPSDIRPVLPRQIQGNRGLANLLISNPAVNRATADCALIDAVVEPYALACILASRARPLVVTAHGSYIPLSASRGAARGLYRQVYRRARIAAVSAYTAERIAGALSIASPEVVLSGVDYEYYQRRRPQPKKRGPTVLFIGAPKKRKGTHVLIEAIAQARQTIPDVQCVIIGKVGTARYARKLARLIAQSGLQDHITLAGHLPYEEVVGWYQAADVLAYPSLSGKTMFEGFGLVILEANACGLPAIGTHGSGNESAIVDGETGFLIDQRSPGALAERIVRCLTDAPLRERLSRGARAFAQAHTWEASAQHMLDFYQRVIDRWGKAR